MNVLLQERLNSQVQYSFFGNGIFSFLFIFVFVVTGGHGLVLFHRHANILVKWHVH